MADRTPLAVGAAVLVAIGVAVVTLWLAGGRAGADWIVPGTLGPSAAVVETDFGAEAVAEGGTGYDGQQVYAIARYFPDLTAAADHLDAPRYRLLRILAPAFAAAAPAGSATVAALVALNVLGLAVGCAALADLAARHGRPAGLGYAFAVALLPALVVTTVEPLAFGLLFAGAAMADRGRHVPAVLVLAAGALTRETVAVLAVTIGVVVLFRNPSDRTAPLLYAVPLGVVAVWYVVLGEIVGGGLPDRFAVFSFVDEGSGAMLLVAGVMATGLVGAVAWRGTVLGPVAAVLSGWTLFYSAGVFDWLALLRVNAPAVALGIAAAGWMATRRRLAPSLVAAPGDP